MVRPRETFKEAIRLSTLIIVAHNHPSQYKS
ncbi:hypothetical protein M3212_09955 [Alkalihalobacillus oceani]|nr:hypothetical protein [Halalkalibacter oceani]